MALSGNTLSLPRCQSLGGFGRGLRIDSKSARLCFATYTVTLVSKAFFDTHAVGSQLLVAESMSDWDLLSSYAGLLTLATFSVFAGSYGSLPVRVYRVF